MPFTGKGLRTAGLKGLRRLFLSPIGIQVSAPVLHMLIKSLQLAGKTAKKCFKQKVLLR